MIVLSIHPNEIYINQTTEVILRLTNKGSGSCTNLRLSFRLSQEILIIGGKSRLPKIERIEKGNHYDYVLRLKATQEGKFYFNSNNFSYLDPIGRSIRPPQLTILIQAISIPQKNQTRPDVEEPEVSEVSKRTKVFISYSHKDQVWLQKVRTHLKVLENEGVSIDIWDDTKIKAGMKWENELQTALSISKIALLLITTDFLASSFITKNELPPLLKAAENFGTKIIPLIVKPSRFDRNKNLSQYQAINSLDKPLVNISEGEQDEILVRLTNTIEDYLQSR